MFETINFFLNYTCVWLFSADLIFSSLILSPSLCSVTSPRTKTLFPLLIYLIHFVSLFGVASYNGEQRLFVVFWTSEIDFQNRHGLLLPWIPVPWRSPICLKTLSSVTYPWPAPAALSTWSLSMKLQSESPLPVTPHHLTSELSSSLGSWGLPWWLRW